MSVYRGNGNKQKFPQEDQNITIMTVPTSNSQIAGMNLNHIKLK
jgi:hypothetical protein